METLVAPGRVVVPLHVVDEVALDVVDAAVGEDADVDLGAHRLLVAVLVVGALLRAADADQRSRDTGQKRVEGPLAAIGDAAAVLVRPASGEEDRKSTR